MGSEPDLTLSSSHSIGISKRDESFTSLTSTTSSQTYVTAKEDCNSSLNSNSLYFTPAGSGGDLDSHILRSKTKREQRSATTDCSSRSGSNSLTLEDGVDSLNSSIMGGLDEEFESSPSPSENAIEVREDISRICNTIAEIDDEDHSKRRKIEEALMTRDFIRLSELAISNGGLLSNALRTKAWPLLLNVSSTDIRENERKKIPTYYPDIPEKIKDLVHLDVARVLKRFPPGLTDPQQDHLQLYLSNLICSVLQENRKAYYYQGFHDISLTFLLVSISQSAPYSAYLCLNKMIESNLNPYMEKTMDKTHDVIHVLFALLEAEDPSLYKKIVIEAKCPVAFCLPWVLTWYSHTLPSDTDVFRLYDFILGSQDKLSHPYLIPIFISTSLILRSAKNIKDDPSLTDIASMHHRLTKLSAELDSLEPWLADSLKLMKKYRGQEDKLLTRGVAIKAFQNRLWNEDNNNRPRPRPPRGLVVSVSSFLFVRHRWTTVSLIMLGTAFLLQTKYGRSVYHFKALKTLLQSHAPEKIQQFIRRWWLVDEGSDE